jgi:hypothetical protein
MNALFAYFRFARTSLAAGLLIAGVQSAVAQTRANANPNASSYERARAALPAAQRTEFAKIVSDARARGVPTDPLSDKVLEGVAKAQPAARILTVVRQRAALLIRAKTLIGTRPATEIVTVADVLQRGLTEQNIRAVRAGARPNEPVGMALHTYADLAERGVSNDVALRMIDGWRERGASAGELRELPAAVERLVRSGANPVRAGSAVAEALKTGQRAGTVKMDNRLRGPPPVGVGAARPRPEMPALGNRPEKPGRGASGVRNPKTKG